MTRTVSTKETACACWSRCVVWTRRSSEVGPSRSHPHGPTHRIPGVDLRSRIEAKLPTLVLVAVAIDTEGTEIARAHESVCGSLSLTLEQPSFVLCQRIARQGSPL